MVDNRSSSGLAVRRVSVRRMYVRPCDVLYDVRTLVLLLISKIVLQAPVSMDKIEPGQPAGRSFAKTLTVSVRVVLLHELPLMLRFLDGNFGRDSPRSGYNFLDTNPRKIIFLC